MIPAKRADKGKNREEAEPLLSVSFENDATINRLSSAQLHNKGNVRLPKRTTKTSQKLALFPDALQSDPVFDFDPKKDKELPHVAANVPKENITTIERKFLPRVTAYCTADSYKLDPLMEYFRRKSHVHMVTPRRYDEVIYTPYTLKQIDESALQQAGMPSFQSSLHETGMSTEGDASASTDASFTDIAKKMAPLGEVLIFDYGVAVFWGLNYGLDY
jgi:uncharacterized Rmd1/YagE family protein